MSTPAIQHAFRHLRRLGVPVTSVTFYESDEEVPRWVYFLEDGTAPAFPEDVILRLLELALDAVGKLPYCERFVDSAEERFSVDWATADDDHLAIDVKGYGSVAISTSDDGLAVDIYPFHAADDAVSGCYADRADLLAAQEVGGSPPEPPVLGTCDVCGGDVRMSPGGTYCPEGHGGAPYTAKEPRGLE